MPSPAPIAIVGMSCRLSGDVSTLDELWTTTTRSRDGWGPVPTDRFSSEAYHHPNPQKKGCFNQKGGYFMQRDLSKFDAPFFQITEQEALAMDPQQRQLLECTYEALENAGLSKDSVAGHDMGVFIGGSSSDYRTGTLRDLKQVPMFDATGNHQSIQAGRISYLFDLRGPCFAVDTACSSSLYALHLAVQSIRSGESDSAIVAGCSLHLQPDDAVSMSMLGIFSEHGKTYSFDHRAKSGFARGEGAGCLILKPLDQALKDNDKIRSVIVNTGTGQDGKTVGLSTPSGDAQEQLIRDVYSRAGISPVDTGFIEAHGTGTKVGDPLEAGALYRVFGSGRTKKSPLYMGSLKTNFGHLENASGIMSVIKASLMLEKGFILPNVNFEKANAAIPLDEWNIKVPTTILPWPRGKRFISVNNFGFGGSNAHAVLERPPLALLDGGSAGLTPKLFVLCANDEKAAKRVAAQMGNYIEQHPEIFEKHLPRDMAYTLGERRTHLPWRIAITATSCDELAKSLNSAATIPRRANTVPKVAFVFTGQGAQWPQMGQDLIETHPVYAQTLRAASKCLDNLGADFSLLEELSRGKADSRVGQANISQPACTAVQLALTALLSSWGVRPSMTIGHSSGEIVAAFAAGAISLEDAMAVAYYRGQVAADIKTKHPGLCGAMIAVGAGPAEVKRTIKLLGLQDGITVACENSPNSVTVSGDDSAVDALACELEKQGLFNRKLRVDVAYHSAHMKLVADDYMATIKKVKSKTTGDENVAFFSSLLGSRADARACGPSYWVDNLTKPVLFSTALQELYEQGKPDIVVEVGPHAALEGPIKQILKGISSQAASEVKYMPCLSRNQNATVTMLNLAGNLFTNGQALDFAAVNQTSAATGLRRPDVVTDFPPYPWSEHKYWFESRTAKQHRLKPFPRHDLLGTLEDTYSEAEPSWHNVLSTDDVPWLKDHRMQSLTTFPLAGYLCMAIEAASQRAQLQGITREQMVGFRLREVQASKAFILDDGAPYETVMSLRAYAEGTRAYSNEWDEFRISSWSSSRGWLEHCRGLVSVKKQSSANPISSLKQSDAISRREIASQLTDKTSLEKFYAELEERGAGYRSAFTLQSNGGLEASSSHSACDVVVPDTSSAMPSSHETPSILPTAFTDLFFQLTFPILGAGRGQMPSLYMPSAIRELEITGPVPNQPGERVQVVAHGLPDPSSPGPVDFFIDAWHTSQTTPVVKIAGFRMTPVNGDAEENQVPRPLCYQVQWQPLVPEAQKPVTNGESHANGNGVTNGHKPAEQAPQTNGNGVHNGHNGHALTNGNGHQVHSTINGDTNGTNGTNGQAYNGHAHNGHNGASVVGDLVDANVTIITTRDMLDPLVATLVGLIHVHSAKATLSSLSDVVSTPNTRYICLAELDAPVLLNMKSKTFKRVQEILLTCSSMLWVSTGAYRFAETPANNMAQGLLRTVRSEMGQVAAGLDLDPESKLDALDRANLIVDALRASFAKAEDGSSLESEFAEEAGQLVVPRVVEQEEMNLAIFRETQSSAPYLQDFEQPGRRLKAVVGTYGALDSLYWQDEAEVPLKPGEIEIKIAATGMNFKDVVIAMGQVPSPYIGVECSGTVARVGSGVSLKVGDRVCAMSLGAYGTYTRCLATSAALIPSEMSFELAATVPVVYSTAYYGLMDLARMEPGEKVLIHAGTGGVGQAAIQLAQMIGAEIYATVGSAEKKQLLIDTYAIPEERIFYSRSTDFGPALRAATGGVDVIVNSLAGDMLRETWDCLAPFGRFIEIGKKDILSNTRLEMAKFEQNCTFSSVDLTLVAAERPKIMGRVLSSVMELLRGGVVQPIGPVTTLGISDVESALRKLQSGKTTGKVVVSHIMSNQQVKATHPKTTAGRVRADGTYVIIGGTGGIGRSMASRLVKRGARHIVLLSRSAAVSAVVKALVQESQDLGASIHVKQCDASDEAQVGSLVKDIGKTMPPIRGVIHAAMVLKDVLFEKMTFEDWDVVVRSKVQGAWNFHTALANKQPLDFFVVLSSVAGIVGNRGQAAYAAANTYLDALVLHRRRHGLEATSLNLAAISGVGYLAENAAKQSQVLKNLSGSTMGEPELLALFEAAIDGKVDSISGGQCITGLDFSDASSLPYYASDGKFSIPRAEALAKASQDTGSSDSADLTISQSLRRAQDAEEAQDMVSGALLDKLGAILMQPMEVMAAQQGTTSITAFGLDSLTAIELRNWIGKELQAHLQVLELLTSGLVRDLAGLVLRKTRLEGVWTKE